MSRNMSRILCGTTFPRNITKSDKIKKCDMGEKCSTNENLKCAKYMNLEIPKRLGFI
jgi:hypothetical protein